ncbi:MAG: N-acetyl-gamma-glutamyl-phosphate reductase [Cyanobacteria bacterium P01_H01_bin.130]
MGDSERISVGIVGASGYGGVQLVRLLMDHPKVELTYLGGNSSAGKDYDEIYPHLTGSVDLKVEAVDVEVIAQRCEVVFLGLPNGIACDLAPQLISKGCKVLDLSADYRFRDLKTYEAWYSKSREDYATAAHAVYGLPELNRESIANASLIGCPGCYPTASLLALLPLLKHGIIVPESIIIDAKSGTSGAGRQAKIHALLAEADNSFAAYGVASHRHTPEIEQTCSDLAGHDVRLQFTPHLVPMPRGILSTVYASIRDPGLVREDVLTIYSVFYRNSPWVRVLPAGKTPQTKWALGTNACFIGVEVDPRTDRVIVLSAIDNLLKGQSGQAVQCMNVMMGWEETLGLPKLGFYP